MKLRVQNVYRKDRFYEVMENDEVKNEYYKHAISSITRNTVVVEVEASKSILLLGSMAINRAWRVILS